LQKNNKLLQVIVLSKTCAINPDSIKIQKHDGNFISPTNSWLVCLGLECFIWRENCVLWHTIIVGRIIPVWRRTGFGKGRLNLYEHFFIGAIFVSL